MTTQLEILGEVVLAMVLGGALGWEREAADKPAGLRTHILVSGAAALIVGLGGAIMEAFISDHNAKLLMFDPIRLIEAVVGAVGFLGAGTVFRRKDENTVEGLTTATSLLFAAGLGVCVAVRQWALAIGITAITLLILRGLGKLEKRLGSKRSTS